MNVNAWFIVGIILLVIGIGVFFFQKSNKSDFVVANSSIFKYVWIGVTVFAVLSLVGSSFTVIKPQTVGIEVQFGKPIRSLNNGLHLKSPLSTVEKLDGTVKNLGFNDPDKEDNVSLEVRLASGAMAYPKANIEYRLMSEDAMQLFLDYRTEDNIRLNTIQRDFEAITSDVFSNYDPLGKDTLKDGEEARINLMRKEITDRMLKETGTSVELRSITMPMVGYDTTTQDRINELQTEIAKTRVAEQKKSTAEAEARSNNVLSNSLSDEVLTSKCLDIIKESGQSPIGCFDGSSVVPYKNVDAQKEN